MADDRTGKQLIKEARDIYFAENAFSVRLHWLDKFMYDSLEDYKNYKNSMLIAPLVGGIIIGVDLTASPRNITYRRTTRMMMVTVMRSVRSMRWGGTVKQLQYLFSL